MNALETCRAAGIALLLAAGLGACDSRGTAQAAGRTADSAGHRVDDRIDAHGTQPGIAIEDAGISARIRAAIFASAELKALPISVDTRHGVVTLSGKVDSPASSDFAGSLARAVSGVTEVRNRLAVIAVASR
jgi:osmotically-inducible protein OsmY